MKVAIVTENPFNMGGAERAIVNLANMLSDYYEVYLVCTSEDADSSKSYFKINQNVKVVKPVELSQLGRGNCFKRLLRFINKKYLGIDNLSFLEFIYLSDSELKQFKNYANKMKFDLIITPQAKKSVLLGAISREVDAICIGWQHSSYKAYFESKHQYYWSQKKLAKKYFSFLDACVVLTDIDVADYRSNLGITCKRIYNSNQFPLQKKTSRNNVTNILWVGRFQKEVKGLDYLIDIAELVIQKCNCVFTLVGDGPDKVSIINEIKRKKMDKKIIFHESTKSIEEYYKKADILISTSRWEGFGLTIVEAMSYGLPVVAFKNSGPSEIIVPGSGILVDRFDVKKFASEIEKLILDESYYYYISKEAVNRANAFSICSTKNEWHNLIEEITK